MISKIRICDITKSWSFLVSHFFLYITKSIFFLYKKTGLFFDITKSVLWYQK